jgi:hypothetical protein
MAEGRGSRAYPNAQARRGNGAFAPIETARQGRALRPASRGRDA